MDRFALDAGASSAGTMSDFLDLLELKGRTWCFVELGEKSGFSVASNHDVLLYAAVRGSARIAGIGDGVVTLATGHVMMILSGEAHAVRVSPDSRMECLDFLKADRNVDIPPVFSLGSGTMSAKILCARLRVEWPGGLQRTSVPPFVGLGDMGAATAAIRCETLQMTSAGKGAATVLTRLASLMLGQALRSHPQGPLLFRLSSKTDPIARVLQLIAADPAADWTIASLAARVGMSRSGFASLFTARIGRTPMDILTERRMLLAASILQRGDSKISEISERVGYRSEAAFSRRFSRFFGMAPGQMRSGVRRKSSLVLSEGVPDDVIQSAF